MRGHQDSAQIEKLHQRRNRPYAAAIGFVLSQQCPTISVSVVERVDVLAVRHFQLIALRNHKLVSSGRAQPQSSWMYLNTECDVHQNLESLVTLQII